MKKVLLLGPVTNLKEGLVGGATISFGYLAEYFTHEQWPVKVINTKKYFGFGSSLKNVISTFTSLCYLVLWADVVFVNSSRGGTKYLAPLAYLITKTFKRKFIFRPFGGDITEYTKSYSTLSQWVFENTILKSDIYYLQTDALIESYREASSNIKQLRTSRKKPMQINRRPNRRFAKKFIYLGFINESKGIKHILEAAELLGPEYTIHIYGPIKEKQFRQMPAYLYRGVLNKEDVLATLINYDVLLLPTYYEGEGYPGAIIEAYSVGLPVITTEWRSISEIVVNGKTGILIEPRSTKSLVNAMKKIDHKNYELYSSNALQYFNNTFNEEIVLGQVKKDILAL